LAQDPKLRTLIKALQQSSGETVTISMATDLCMEVMLVERSSQLISFTAEVGQRISFWGSAIGAAYLTTLSPASLTSLYDRSLRHGGSMAPALALRDVQAQVAEARSAGHALAIGAVFPDASAIACPLSRALSFRQLVVSIAGPTDRVEPQATQLALSLQEAAMRAADV
jgi:DNA-binding IclR family transcriptional regulator